MKTALCLSGRFERFKECVPTIYKNVVEPNDCDVYIHTEDDEEYREAEKWLNKEGHSYEKCVATPYEEIPEDIPLLRKMKGRNFMGAKYETEPHWYRQRALQQLSHIKECFYLITERYDCYIRLRLDMVVNEPVLVSGLDMSKIHIPHAKDSWLNDRFAVGGYDVMKVYADRIDIIRDVDGNVEAVEKELALTMKHMSVPVENIAYPMHRIGYAT